MADKNVNTALLKVLCIHGYRQNAQTFRERTGAFRKIIKKHAELAFITAPNIVPPMPEADGSVPDNNSSDQRGWWFSRKDDYFRAQDDSDCTKGYEESLKTIRKAFEEEGPFDGVLGFSQGASMVSLLCGLQEQNHPLASGINFKFAIMIAGFKSRSASHSPLYDKTITMPTLHVYGETDQVIGKEMSEDLLQSFSNPLILTHPGGHFIPASGPQKKIYLQFLEDMKLLCSH